MFHIEIEGAPEYKRYINEKYQESMTPYSWEKRENVENVVKSLIASKRWAGVGFIIVDEDEIVEETPAPKKVKMDADERDAFILKNATAFGGEMSVKAISEATDTPEWKVYDVIFMNSEHPKLQKTLHYIEKNAVVFGGNKKLDQVAKRLGLSPSTVDRYCQYIRKNPSAPEEATNSKPTPKAKALKKVAKKNTSTASTAESVIEACSTLNHATVEVTVIARIQQIAQNEERVRCDLFRYIEQNALTSAQAKKVCAQIYTAAEKQRKAEEALSLIQKLK